MMHEYLEIKTDKEILDTVISHGTTTAEADQYCLEEVGEGPNLERFAPCWEDLNHSWNSDLATDFVEEYFNRYPGTVTASEVKGHFMDRLRRLYGYIKSAHAHGIAAAKEKEQEKRDKARRRSRLRKVNSSAHHQVLAMNCCPRSGRNGSW